MWSSRDVGGLLGVLLQHRLVSRLDRELPLKHSGILMDSSRWVQAAAQEQYQTTQACTPIPFTQCLVKICETN